MYGYFIFVFVLYALSRDIVAKAQSDFDEITRLHQEHQAYHDIEENSKYIGMYGPRELIAPNEALQAGRARFYDAYKKVPSSFPFTVMSFSLTAGVDLDDTKPVQLAIIVSGYGTNPFDVDNVEVIDTSPVQNGDNIMKHEKGTQGQGRNANEKAGRNDAKTRKPKPTGKPRAKKTAKATRVKSKKSKSTAKPSLGSAKAVKNSGVLFSSLKSGNYALVIESEQSKLHQRSLSLEEGPSKQNELKRHALQENRSRHLVDGAVENDIHAMASLVGDVNNDFHVTQEDINIIEGLYGFKIGDSSYLSSADVNADGMIDQNDVKLSSKNLGAWIQSETKSAVATSKNETSVELPNVGKVIFHPGILADGSTVLLRKTMDTSSQDEFDQTALIFSSSAKLGYEIRVEISNRPDPGFLRMIANIPNDLLAAISLDHQIEVFAKVVHGSLQDGAIPTFMLLPSTFDSLTRSVEFQLPLQTFLLNDIGNYESVVTLASTPGRSPDSPLFTRSLLLTSAVCGAASIRCPLDKCILTASFGMWNHPITNEFKMHYGVDYKASVGQSVYAAASGTVLDSRHMNGYGNTVVLRHKDGSATLYAHLSEISVATGQNVIVGEEIAKAGSTGTVTGPNLHVEYIPNGSLIASKDRIDPHPCIGFLTKGSITTGDNGSDNDDAFELLINGMSIGVTAVGVLVNNLSINNLRPGTHTLELIVVIAPDNLGTFYVQLNDGLKFIDGTDRIEGSPRQGTRLTWSIIVPDVTEPIVNDFTCESSFGSTGECMDTTECSERFGTFEAGKCLEVSAADVSCCFKPTPCSVSAGIQGQCMDQSQCTEFKGIAEIGHCPNHPNTIECCYQPVDSGVHNPELCSAILGDTEPIVTTSKPNNFISRYGWSADDYKCGDGDCSKPKPMVPKEITIHHTAGPSSQGPLEIQQNYHNTKGSCDIGYHFLVDKLGNIYQGLPFSNELGPGSSKSKSGWPDKLGLIQGDHVPLMNEGKIGIALIGCFDQGSWCSSEVKEVTSLGKGTAQYESLIILIRFLTSVFSINIMENVKPHNYFNPSLTCPGKNVVALFDAIVAEANEDPHKELIECQVGEIGAFTLTGFCAGRKDCLDNLEMTAYPAITHGPLCVHMSAGQDPVCCVMKPNFDSIKSFDLKSNIIHDELTADIDNLLLSRPTVVAESGLSISVSCEQNSGNPKLEFMSDFTHLSSSPIQWFQVGAKTSRIDDDGKSFTLQLEGLMQYSPPQKKGESPKYLLLHYQRIVRFTCNKYNPAKGKWVPAASDDSNLNSETFLNDVASFPRMPDWWNEEFMSHFEDSSTFLKVAFVYAVATAIFHSLPSFKGTYFFSEQVDGICEAPNVQSVHSQKQEDLALLPKEILLLSQQASEFCNLVYDDRINLLPSGQIQKLYEFYPTFPTGKWRKDQAFVAKADDVCYGVFQGTIPRAEWSEDITVKERIDFLRDWGENFKPLNGQKCGCIVRRGFLDMYNNRKYIDDFRKSINECVHSCAGENCDLVLTGHSQGGGIALVAAIDLHVHNPYVITFGAPSAIHRPCKYINEDRIYQFKNTLVEKANGRLRYDFVGILPGADRDIGRHFLLGDGGESVAHYASPPPDFLDAVLDFKPLASVLIHMYFSNWYKVMFGPDIINLKADLDALLSLIGATDDAHDLITIQEIPYHRGYIQQLKELYPPSSTMQHAVRATGFDIGHYCVENAECISNMCEDRHCALHECKGNKWEFATVTVGGFLDGIKALDMHAYAYNKAQSIPSLGKLLGGGADAFKKCYWNCIMVIEFGATANEPEDFSNLYPQCFKETSIEKMNLHNSRVGRVYGQMYATTDSQCEKFCLDGVSNGKLYTIR